MLRYAELPQLPQSQIGASKIDCAHYIVCSEMGYTMVNHGKPPDFGVPFWEKKNMCFMICILGLKHSECYLRPSCLQCPGHAMTHATNAA